MKWLRCPNCGEYTIPFWKKLLMAFKPATAIYPKCKRCHKKYGFEIYSMWPVLTLILLALIWAVVCGIYAIPRWLGLGVVWLMILSTIAVLYFFFPLESKEDEKK